MSRSSLGNSLQPFLVCNILFSWRWCFGVVNSLQCFFKPWWIIDTTREQSILFICVIADTPLEHAIWLIAPERRLHGERTHEFILFLPHVFYA